MSGRRGCSSHDISIKVRNRAARYGVRSFVASVSSCVSDASTDDIRQEERNGAESKEESARETIT